MSKRCNHGQVYVWGANAMGQTISRYASSYQTALQSVRAPAMIRCKHCGETLSIGPSNDEPDIVAIEMRAAELEETEFWKCVDAGTYERWGFEDHQNGNLEGICGPHLTTQQYLAGWLSGELEAHAASTIRDADAWSRDISRPIAEHLAETARDDAAAREVTIATLDRGDGPEPVASSFVSPAYAAEYEATRDAEPDCRDEDDTTYLLGAHDPNEDVMRDPVITAHNAEVIAQRTVLAERLITEIAHEDASAVCACTGDALRSETCEVAP